MMLEYILLPAEREEVNEKGREAALVNQEVRATANTEKGTTGFCFVFGKIYTCCWAHESGKESKIIPQVYTKEIFLHCMVIFENCVFNTNWKGSIFNIF